MVFPRGKVLTLFELENEKYFFKLTTTPVAYYCIRICTIEMDILC